MTIYNLGSINADMFYQVPAFPAPGETLAASGLRRGLGGKGANQSVAAARAGARVVHIGAVGPDGAWAPERLRELGVETDAIITTDEATGHAIILVNDAGENEIVIWPGANRNQRAEHVRAVLGAAAPGDILLMQNETDCQTEAAQAARNAGMRLLYSAAPFSVNAVRAVLDDIHILLVNEVEADQLFAALETDISHIPVSGMVITKGAQGAMFRDRTTGKTSHVAALPVKAVDTTAAGDTFAGYFAAALDRGKPAEECLHLAAAAAALKVTRHGTADAIPSLAEVERFAAARPG